MRRQIVKWSYLTVLVVGIVYLLNTFAAGYVLIRAEGLVAGQPATVAAEYTATVREVFVKEGQQINKGDVVAQISSQAIVESRARLASDYALRVSKLAELNPVENVWQFMRDNWLSNRIFKSYDDLVDHCFGMVPNMASLQPSRWRCGQH